MKKNKLLLICAFTIVIAIQFSCMNYYKISKTSQNRSTPDIIIQANLQRYFILRNGDSAYYMSNIISNDKKSLTCTLDTLSSQHKLHLANGRNGKMRFKKYTPEAVVLNEVHIYIQQDTTALPGNNYTLMFDKIQKTEVLEKNKGRTTTSYILGGICIVVSILAIGTAVAIGAGGTY
jgi:hypothetical protein